MQVHDEANKPLIEWSEESALLAQSAATLLAERSTFEAVRKWMTTERGFYAEVYKEIADLGWLGVALPEQYGGAGLSVAALTGVAEAMGQRLFGSPFLANTIAAQVILRAGNDKQKNELLPKIVKGELNATLAFYEPHGSYEIDHVATTAERALSGYQLRGKKSAVLDAQYADVVIIAAKASTGLMLLLATQDQ
ncbi:MAG TPA: acyl-CoA dehydrogenase family protein, partial [Polyangiales bacterium]|nr:acyl-CoA dehydrogenase family protein [Polyangiales bacterium]